MACCAGKKMQKENEEDQIPDMRAVNEAGLEEMARVEEMERKAQEEADLAARQIRDREEREMAERRLEAEELEARRLAEEAEAKRLAEEMAAEAKRLAEEKAAEAKRLAEEKAAEEAAKVKRLAEEKAAAEQAAAEQAAAEQRRKEEELREEEERKQREEREARAEAERQAQAEAEAEKKRIEDAEAEKKRKLEAENKRRELYAAAKKAQEEEAEERRNNPTFTDKMMSALGLAYENAWGCGGGGEDILEVLQLPDLDAEEVWTMKEPLLFNSSMGPSVFGTEGGEGKLGNQDTLIEDDRMGRTAGLAA